MIIAFLLSIVVSLIIFFTTGSSSSFMMSLITLFIGSLFTITIEKKDRIYGFNLFCIVFSAYTILALFHYLDIASDYSFFLRTGKDELNFFLFSESYKSNSIPELFNTLMINQNQLVINNEGYLFYISSIASLATSYFDGNHILLQFLGSTLFGSLASILLFRFLILHVDAKKAFRFALIFMLFSAFNRYSISLLRDIHIAFFFLWGFVIISREFSLKGLFGLVVLTTIIWQLRYEHGVAFIFFIIYYIYIALQKRKGVFILLIIAIIAVSTPLIVTNYTKIEHTITIYEEFAETQTTLQGDDSFGKRISLLPSPLFEIAMLLYSQIQPFPSWGMLQDSRNIYGAVVSLLPIFYSFFWFVIIFSLIKWCVFEKRAKYLDPKIIILTIIVLIFLFIITTVNMNVRRIMSVYPVLYLVYVLIKNYHIDKVNGSQTTRYAILTYFSLIVVYLSMKAIL